MNVLVTGGAGYIGSHTCCSLIQARHKVIIADNFSNSSIGVINSIKRISNETPLVYVIDVTCRQSLESVFSENEIDGIIHFAGYKSVRESVEQPLTYYRNNLLSTIGLLEACEKHDIQKFVFSSSATIYGDNVPPFKETMTNLSAVNPYGETKLTCERILQAYAKSNQSASITILRYFNPIGAHASGMIGDNPKGIPNNLMPYVTQVAKSKLPELLVYGNDYDTIDGTGVRDYIHVVDLAKGHVAALDQNSKGVSIYNLGTGKGYSVLEIIRAFERANGISIPYRIVDRRPGDVAISYADISKAQKELMWKPQLDLNDMVKDAWNYERNHKD